MGPKTSNPTSTRSTSARPVFDGYDVERRRHEADAHCTLSKDSSTTSASADDGGGSSAIVQQGTKDQQDLFVDSKENPTQLYLRINYRLWDMALKALSQNPGEAAIWIRSGDNVKNLPLHLVCQQGPTPAPVSLVHQLIQAYPSGIKQRNSVGELPIHLACRNSALVRAKNSTMEGVAVLVALVEAHPESLTLGGGIDGKTPLKILASSPNGASIVQMLQMKLQLPQQSNSNKIPWKLPLPIPPTQLPQSDAGGSDLATELNRSRLLIFTTEEPASNPLVGQIFSRTWSTTDSKAQSDLYLENVESIVSVGDIDNRLMIHHPCTPRANASPHHHTGGWVNHAVVAANREEVGIPLIKALQEMENLKRKMESLCEENLAAQMDRQERETVINILQKAVEQEQRVGREHIRALEDQVTASKDQLLTAHESIASKSKAQQELAERVLYLESCSEEMTKEISTLKSDLWKASSVKEALQQTLQQSKDKLGMLQDELDVKNREISHLIDQTELSRTESSKCRVASEVAQKAAAELQRSLDEKGRLSEERELQIRAFTEARRISEKRIVHLETANASLHAKNANLANVLRQNQESFQSNLAKVESAMKLQCADLESLRVKLAEAKSQDAGRDRELKDLSEARQERVDVENKLVEVTKSCDKLQENSDNLTQQVVKLTESLQATEAESLEKNEIIFELERSVALLQKELETNQVHHDQLQQRSDKLTKKIMEDQSLQKITAKSQVLKNELRRVLSLNSTEVRKNSESQTKITCLEERIAVAESSKASADSECTKLRQVVEMQKKKSDEIKKDLIAAKHLNKSQLEQIHKQEGTIASLKGKNRDLTERCDELRAVFCAGVDKIEASCSRPPTAPTNNPESETLLQAAISDLQNLVDDLREENQALHEQHDYLRTCLTEVQSDSQRDEVPKKLDVALHDVSGLAALYEEIEAIRDQAGRLDRLLNNQVGANVVKLLSTAEGNTVNGEGIPDFQAINSCVMDALEKYHEFTMYDGAQLLSPANEKVNSLLCMVKCFVGTFRTVERTYKALLASMDQSRERSLPPKHPITI